MSRVPYDQRIAEILVKGLARTPLTPNMVTTFGLVAGLAAAWLFAQGDPGLRHWAAAVFLYAVFNDHVDGQLARATGKTSRFGHYYDHVAASTAYVGMFVGAGLGFSDGWLGPWAVALGLAAGISVTIIFATRVAVEVKAGTQAVKQNSFAGFEIEDTLYIVGPVTWLGQLEPFLVAAGIGTPLFLIWVLIASRREIAAARARQDPQSPQGS